MSDVQSSPGGTTAPAPATRPMMRTAAGVALGLASGGLATLAFPPFELWPLIFVAFVPMVVAQHRILPKGLGPLAPGAAIGAYYAGQLSAGTWGNPVYALYAQPWLLQPLTVFGLFGLELLLLVINFAVAGLVIALLDRRRAPEGAPVLPMARALRAAGVVGALAVAWTIMSLVQFQNHPATLRVGTVQANAPRDPEEELARNVAATRALAAQGAKLVVWREGMLKFHPLRERTAELKALAAETGAHIALGYGLKQPDGLRLNEAVLFAPDGQVFGPYGKSHPGRFAGDQSDTGGDYKVYDTALGKVATIICYDLDFTDTAREMARRGAGVIAVPSNDVPAIATTHYTHLVFRAIENRLPMAKADSLFDTAIVDPYGRLLARNVNPLSMAEARRVTATRELAAQTLIADVPLATGPTVTTRLGDWMGWLAIGAMLVAAGSQVVRRFRRRDA